MREYMQKVKSMIVSLLNVQEEITTSKDATNLKEASPLILWNSCDTLPVKIFYEILKTKNLNLLIKNHESHEKSEQLNQKLNDLWSDILDEYWQLTNLTRYKANLRKTKSLITKQNQYTTFIGILTLAEYGAPVQKYLEYWKIKTIQEVQQKVRVLKTNIGLAIAKIEEPNDTKDAYNFYSDLVVIEQILKRSLNAESITVSYWAELNKLAKKINKGK